MGGNCCLMCRSYQETEPHRSDTNRGDKELDSNTQKNSTTLGHNNGKELGRPSIWGVESGSLTTGWQTVTHSNLDMNNLAVMGWFAAKWFVPLTQGTSERNSNIFKNSGTVCSNWLASVYGSMYVIDVCPLTLAVKATTWNIFFLHAGDQEL